MSVGRIFLFRCLMRGIPVGFAGDGLGMDDMDGVDDVDEVDEVDLVDEMDVMDYMDNVDNVDNDPTRRARTGLSCPHRPQRP